MSRTPEAIIHRAETQRAKGNYKDALWTVSQQAAILPSEIPQLSQSQLRDKMRLWRIWEVTLQGIYQNTPDAKKALPFLRGAQHVIEQYFYNPTAWEAAKNMQRDVNGSEYLMAAEMCRDEGKYHLLVAKLFGNSEFIDLAINSFDEAIELSQQGTTVQALATMEREMMRRERGDSMDVTSFDNAYKVAAQLARTSRNWDRLATISWWFVRESLHANHKDKVQVGLRNLLLASIKGKQNPLRFAAKEGKRRLYDTSRAMTLPDQLDAHTLMINNE